MENVGDKVKTILKPAVAVVDKVAKTDLEHCESCERIRQLLNDKEWVKAFKERFNLK